MFCSTEFVSNQDDDCPPIENIGLAAWSPGDKIWNGRTQLKVYFMQDIPEGWKIKGENLMRDDILQTANVWHRKGPNIPEFVLAKKLDSSDIRVKFYGKLNY